MENIEDAHQATHVIVTDGKISIRRTPKLMIAMCRTPNVLSSAWLTQSAANGTFLPVDDFMVRNDEKAEKLYNFSLKESIDRIKINQLNHTLLLQGWLVFVCKGVAGNRSPPENEFRAIVEAAGGTWISSSSLLQSKKEWDPVNIIIITSDPEEKKQTSIKDVAAVLKKGATKKNTTWLFHSILMQKLEI